MIRLGAIYLALYIHACDGRRQDIGIAIAARESGAKARLHLNLPDLSKA